MLPTRYLLQRYLLHIKDEHKEIQNDTRGKHQLKEGEAILTNKLT